MDGYSYLEHMLRYTGAIVALVASFLAAPEATRHLWSALRGRAVTISQTVAAQVKGAWNRLRGHGRARGSTAGSAGLAITTPATAGGRLVFPVDTAAPLPERVARLEGYIQTLREMHYDNRRAIREEAAKRAGAVKEVLDEVRRESAVIRSEIGSPVLCGLFIAGALVCLELAWIHFWAAGTAGKASESVSGR